MTAPVRRLPRLEPSERPDAATPLRASARTADIDARLTVFINRRSYGAAQYHALRHLVEEGHRHGGLSVLAVTSPVTGEGKTTTAINLAGALAQTSASQVLLVDADLRRPAIARRLALEPDHAGLVEAILDRNLSLAAVAEPYPGFNLAVVRAGRLAETTYEVLHSPRLGDLLQEARGQYEYVVVDTPPLLPIPDARVIGKWVDGFLLVVCAGRTLRKLVEESLNLMSPEKMMGLVFNGDRRTPTRLDYYDYADGGAAGATRPSTSTRVVARLREILTGGATPWR